MIGIIFVVVDTHLYDHQKDSLLGTCSINISIQYTIYNSFKIFEIHRKYILVKKLYFKEL